MKKINILLVVAVMLLAFGCKSKEKVVEKQTSDAFGEEVVTPCSGPEYESDDLFFRATASAVSQDLDFSYKKAITEAKALISGQIKENIQTTMTAFKSEYGASGLQQKETEMIVTASDNTVSNIRTICKKTFNKEGQYTTFVSLEVSTDQVLQSIKDEISRDEELRTDFEFEKFKDFHKEQMERLKEEGN